LLRDVQLYALEIGGYRLTDVFGKVFFRSGGFDREADYLAWGYFKGGLTAKQSRCLHDLSITQPPVVARQARGQVNRNAPAAKLIDYLLADPTVLKNTSREAYALAGIVPAQNQSLIYDGLGQAVVKEGGPLRLRQGRVSEDRQ
jgi:hypothetical protein